MSKDPAENAGFKYYFIFGEDPKTGLVDIADIDGDVAICLRREDAERLIRDRTSLMQALNEALWKLKDD